MKKQKTYTEKRVKEMLEIARQEEAFKTRQLPEIVRMCEMAREKALKEAEAKQKEFIEKLHNWINNENGTGKYFMSLGIDKLNEKIDKLSSEVFGKSEVGK